MNAQSIVEIDFDKDGRQHGFIRPPICVWVDSNPHKSTQER